MQDGSFEPWPAGGLAKERGCTALVEVPMHAPDMISTHPDVQGKGGRTSTAPPPCPRSTSSPFLLGPNIEQAIARPGQAAKWSAGAALKGRNAPMPSAMEAIAAAIATPLATGSGGSGGAPAAGANIGAITRR